MKAWKDLTVVVIGAARQGLALTRYLVQRGARVRLTDSRPQEELPEAYKAIQDFDPAEQAMVATFFGGHPLHILEHADLVCPSGGVPTTNSLVVEALRRGIPVSNDSQLFLEEAPCKVIGITGSAGKTTTTTLVGLMANAALLPGRVWVGGNIGSPLIERVVEMQAIDLAVAEMSSFQLEWMTRSPQIAAVLNITPNHLDRHANMQDYIAAKARILDFQSSGDAAVLNREDPVAWSLAGKVAGKLVTFGLQHPGSEAVSGSLTGTFLRGDYLVLREQGEIHPIMPRQEVLLRGEHNLYNVLAACAIGHVAGLPIEALRAGVAGFRGVAHRLEFVRTWGGAEWYNDSIATAPERSIAAMRSFREPVVLLAGGRDKNLPWEDFAVQVKRRAKHVILFGEAAEKIECALREKDGSVPVTRCDSLNSAVRVAARIVSPGDVVLLSPGGTSFDEFRDFEERGEAFRRWVMELP